MKGCSAEGRTREPSPIDAPEPGDGIEVPVSVQERRILTAEHGNPQIIARNRLTFLFSIPCQWLHRSDWFLRRCGCLGIPGRSNGHSLTDLLDRERQNRLRQVIE